MNTIINMMDTLIYLVIGVTLMFLMEIIINLNKSLNGSDDDVYFGNVEKVILILIWPIMLTLFIFHFIKSMIK